MTQPAYPRLIKRVRAVLIDSVLMPVVFIGSLILGDALGVTQAYGKLLLIFLPIFVLEPGLVAFTGGTVGHHLIGIRVTRASDARNINIFAALLRFIVKLLFGWLSFIFVLTTRKHQALHDLIAVSRVVHKNPQGLPSFEVLEERKPKIDDFDYPPAWRRVTIIVGYATLATLALSLSSILLVSASCLNGQQCTTLDMVLDITLSILWLLGLGWIVVRGWTGMLYGCKRRKHVIESYPRAGDSEQC